MTDYSKFRIPALFAFIVLLASCIYGAMHPGGLPFTLSFVDANTALVTPIEGVSLPAGLQAGDRVDLAALDTRAHIAVLAAGTLLLRARDNEELVRALARGTLEPAAARERARAIEATWAGA